MPDLRELIREVLAEELATLRLSGNHSDPKVRTIVMRNDADLVAFVNDLLQRASDPQFVRDVTAGQLQFRLSESAARQLTPPVAATAPVPSNMAAASYTLVASSPAKPLELNKSIITERDVATLPRDQQRLRVGKNSRLTPLAADELRRRGIKVERIST